MLIPKKLARKRAFWDVEKYKFIHRKAARNAVI
ncbi:MAG: hypothetical protein ACI8PB_003939 [Desulforhopalus sp.]